MTKLSICIPTYKRAALLGSTLSHLALVAEADTQIVISDNCSNDGTSDVAKSFEGQFGSLIYACQRENRGPLENLQTALSLASGKYAYVLSDDDRIVPEGIEAAISFMETHPEVVAVYGGYQEWDPISDQILSERIPLTEPKIYDSSDKLELLNKYTVLWFPIVRADVFQRFCFYDDNTFGFWRLVSMLLKQGKISVIPDVLYKHAQTVPRLEYDLTEAWYHDMFRGDFEMFLAEMEVDHSNSDTSLEFLRFVGSRAAVVYLTGARFSRMKKELIKQRYFLLRAKAYGFVNQEQLFNWEKECLFNAAAERFKKIIISIPDVQKIIVEDTEVLRGFMEAVAHFLSNMPQVLYVDKDEFIKIKATKYELLISEIFETLACRIIENREIFPGLQHALYDILSTLRVTNIPMRLSKTLILN